MSSPFCPRYKRLAESRSHVTLTTTLARLLVLCFSAQIFEEKRNCSQSSFVIENSGRYYELLTQLSWCTDTEFTAGFIGKSGKCQFWLCFGVDWSKRQLRNLITLTGWFSRANHDKSRCKRERKLESVYHLPQNSGNFGRSECKL